MNFNNKQYDRTFVPSSRSANFSAPNRSTNEQNDSAWQGPDRRNNSRPRYRSNSRNRNYSQQRPQVRFTEERRSDFDSLAVDMTGRDRMAIRALDMKVNDDLLLAIETLLTYLVVTAKVFSSHEPTITEKPVINALREYVIKIDLPADERGKEAYTSICEQVRELGKVAAMLKLQNAATMVAAAREDIDNNTFNCAGTSVMNRLKKSNSVFRAIKFGTYINHNWSLVDMVTEFNKDTGDYQATVIAIWDWLQRKDGSGMVDTSTNPNSIATGEAHRPTEVQSATDPTTVTLERERQQEIEVNEEDSNSVVEEAIIFLEATESRAQPPIIAPIFTAVTPSSTNLTSSKHLATAKSASSAQEMVTSSTTATPSVARPTPTANNTANRTGLFSNLFGSQQRAIKLIYSSNWDKTAIYEGAIPGGIDRTQYASVRCAAKQQLNETKEELFQHLKANNPTMAATKIENGKYRCDLCEEFGTNTITRIYEHIINTHPNNGAAQLCKQSLQLFRTVFPSNG
jgi:hypothetical protein